MIGAQFMLVPFYHQQWGPLMRLAVYFLSNRGEGREMVTLHAGSPDEVLTLLGIFIPITQCIPISYLENTLILSFM